MDKREEVLTKIESAIKHCKKCRLCKTATNAVPGSGNLKAEIVFIGEAPGRNEDLQGLPFVGRAGKLLDAMLKEINLDRKDVWIGNIIKHRPPDNRDPLPDEIQACQPYLKLQLKAIQPLLIVTLGRFSMNYFYPDGKISRDRGGLIKIGGYNVYPVYHPAAALRNPTMMLGFKEDFLEIPNVIEKIKNGKVDESTALEKETNDGQLSLGI